MAGEALFMIASNNRSYWLVLWVRLFCSHDEGKGLDETWNGVFHYLLHNEQNDHGRFAE